MTAPSAAPRYGRKVRLKAGTASNATAQLSTLTGGTRRIQTQSRSARALGLVEVFTLTKFFVVFMQS